MKKCPLHHPASDTYDGDFASCPLCGQPSLARRLRNEALTVTMVCVGREMVWRARVQLPSLHIVKSEHPVREYAVRSAISHARADLRQSWERPSRRRYSRPEVTSSKPTDNEPPVTKDHVAVQWLSASRTVWMPAELLRAILDLPVDDDPVPHKHSRRHHVPNPWGTIYYRNGCRPYDGFVTNVVTVTAHKRFISFFGPRRFMIHREDAVSALQEHDDEKAT